MIHKANAKQQAAKKSGAKNARPQSPSRLIDARIKKVGDWRAKALAHVIKVIFAKGAALKDPSRLVSAAAVLNTSGVKIPFASYAI